MGKGKKILVVDDEKDIIELLQYNLEQEGRAGGTLNLFLAGALLNSWN